MYVFESKCKNEWAVVIGANVDVGAKAFSFTANALKSARVSSCISANGQSKRSAEFRPESWKKAIAAIAIAAGACYAMVSGPKDLKPTRRMGRLDD